MSATPEEHSMRLDVLDRVTNVIHTEWPKAKVEVFGSFRTGLYLPTRYNKNKILILFKDSKYFIPVFISVIWT